MAPPGPRPAPRPPAPGSGDATAPGVAGSAEARQVHAEDLDRLRRFQDLVERSEEGIVELDAEERVTYANPRAATLLGRARAQLLDEPISDLVEPAQLRFEHGWSARLDDPDVEVLRGEISVPHSGPGGAPRTLQVAAHAHRRDGVLHRVTAVLTDVTDKQQRVVELEQARAHLEEAQRVARLGHWRADSRTEAVEWSPMTFRIFGVDPEHFAGTFAAFLELVHPADRERVAAAGRSARRQGSLDHVFRVLRPDGTGRVVHELAERELGTDGDTVLVGTVQDVTELHRTQEALRRSEELLSRVLAATNDGWWDADLVAGTANHSDRWWRIHGYEPGELSDTLTVALELTNPDDLPRLQAELDRVVTEQRPSFTTVSRVRHRDGHLVPVRIHAVVDYDPGGRPVRVSGALTDITDIVTAQRLQEQFVSTVSHELRTPLTAIGGALESLAGGVAGELSLRARTLVEVGLRNSTRLRTLIDDLLDLEGLRGNTSVVTADAQDLGLLVHDAVELHAGLASTHGVRFAITELPDEPLRVRINPHRFQQILGNYLSNAAKYAPAGSTVELRIERRDTRARIEVVDTGPGVPSGFAHRAFQRFAQADPSDPRSRGGTGLGLAITREIAEHVGGEVGYASRPGRTSFFVELPLDVTSGA